MAAPVMCNAAITVGRKKNHLVFKCVRAQGPTMAKDHGLPTAPIFVVNLRSVFGRNRIHETSPYIYRLTCASRRTVESEGWQKEVIGKSSKEFGPHFEDL